jgi:hypothetical protein
VYHVLCEVDLTPTSLSPNKLEELPATVKATTVKLTIEKTNSVLTAVILSIEVKACIEGKL